MPDEVGVIKFGALCFVCISQLERTSESEKK